MTLSAGTKAEGGGEPAVEAGDIGIVEVPSELRRRLGVLQMIF